MQIKDPKPEILRLEELALMVKSGEIKLPRFQRPFVWREADMLKLLDSIYKGYPIGSILLWNSSQKLRSERSILGLAVDTGEHTSYPTNYLLDGQQRLTTLCGALFWDGIEEDSKWNIHFDLETQQFVYPRRSDLTTLFPLNRIIDTRDFIRQCMKFESHPKRDEFFQKAERLLKSIKDYKLAVVKIGDMTIEEVAPIFERINSTGRKLTMVDLMMAATWSNGFDLTETIQKIGLACKSIGFDEIPDQIILRSISASANLGINKDDIQKLREKSPDALSDAAEQAENALISALLFLKTEIGIHDYSYLPYGFQLTYISEFFRLNRNPTSETIEHLKKWFWLTSVTRYFGTSNSGQVTRDLSLIRSYAGGTAETLFENNEIDISRLLFDRFNLRNATSTTFTVLLNWLSPKETVDIRPIDGSHLKVKSARFFGTFAPFSADYRNLNFVKVIYPYSDSDSLDLSNDKYARLEQHLLDAECVAYRNEEQVEKFLAQRCKIISEVIERLTGCHTRFSTGSISSIPVDDIDDSDDNNDELEN